MEYAIDSKQYVTVSTTDEKKTQVIGPRRTLSAEYIVTGVRRHKYATFFTTMAVIAFGVAFSVYKYNGAPQISEINGAFAPVIGPSTTEGDLKLSRFPSSGKMAQIAISPDGKYIAYITADGPEKNTIRLRGRETSSDIEVVPAPSEGTLADIGFSPDSRQIYYRHRNPPGIQDTINRVSVAGGPPTKIIVDAESGGSLSPDGKMLAFSREIESGPSGGGDDVIVANADGSNEKVLVHSPTVGHVWTDCGQVPAWSPDGKSLACMKYSDSPEGRYVQISMVNPMDSTVRTRDEKWWEISGAVFMPDSSLAISAKPMSAEKLAPAQLWLITPNGSPKSITSDVNGYSSLSATRKGDVLVTLQSRDLRDLWGIRGNDISTARQITNSGELVSGGGFSWTPDGRILFISSVSGNADIWIMNDDGSGRKQLTSNHGVNMRAVMSQDGRYIVFMGSQNNFGGWHLFRMDADGSNVKQLTSGWQERNPRISLDRKSVYYIEISSMDDTTWGLCKVPIDGGDPVVLAAGVRNLLDVSPRDGSILYIGDGPPNAKTVESAKIMSPSDPSNIKTVVKPAGIVFGGAKWSFDGQYLMVTDKKNPSFDTLQTVFLNGKMRPKPLLTFPGPIGDFGWSKDGKQLGFVRSSRTSEAVIITNKGTY